MHQPVLMQETLNTLCHRRNGVYVDGTLGSGGHAEAVLEWLNEDGILYGIDRDQEAIDRSCRRLQRFGSRFRAIHGDYRNIGSLLTDVRITEVDGILLDLGVSSEQLDEADRGFSFMNQGPLDMRMDQRQPTKAADVVNAYPEESLRQLLWDYGEETSARRIAEAIIKRRDQRPFETTGDLAELIAKVKGGRRGRRHPATRSFQAIRMEVNQELQGLDQGLEQSLRHLSPCGRLAVISFHSLEDRKVKCFFKEHEGRWESLPEGGERWLGEDPPVRCVTRKAVQPTKAECLENPRARSSKLRVVERLMGPQKRKR